MRRRFAALFAALLPLTAQAQDSPTTGLPLFITGAALSGVGALNLVTLPVCSMPSYEDFVGSDGAEACRVGSIAVGVIGLGVGVPMHLVGRKQRAAYKEWKQQTEIDVGVQPLPGGAMLVSTGRF